MNKPSNPLELFTYFAIVVFVVIIFVLFNGMSPDEFALMIQKVKK